MGCLRGVRKGVPVAGRGRGVVDLEGCGEEDVSGAATNVSGVFSRGKGC